MNTEELNRMSLKIGLVGTGNVAWHLSKRFSEIDLSISVLFGRKATKPEDFGHVEQCDYAQIPEKVWPELDVLILAIQDDAIPELASKLDAFSGLVCHTSGSVPLEALCAQDKDFSAGILYPLYSFRKGTNLNWAEIPFLLEADNPSSLNVLETMVRDLGSRIHFANSTDRANYHVAAVFANNYTNFMYDLADEYLDRKNLDMKVLHAIIKQTAERIQSERPFNVQTGPAVRNDEQTLARHEAALSDLKLSQKVYRFLAESLKKRHG